MSYKVTKSPEVLSTKKNTIMIFCNQMKAHDKYKK